MVNGGAFWGVNGRRRSSTAGSVVNGGVVFGGLTVQNLQQRFILIYTPPISLTIRICDEDSARVVNILIACNGSVFVAELVLRDLLYYVSFKMFATIAFCTKL